MPTFNNICPSCKGKLKINKLSCLKCDIDVTGNFNFSDFDYLTEEDQKFIYDFLLAEGNLKKLQRDNKISYLNIKNKLSDILEQLNLKSKPKLRHNNSSENKNLPDNLRGRSIFERVIPTVCNLKNLLEKLDEVDGDFTNLKQWEKISYRSYLLDDIIERILHKDEKTKKDIIRENILHSNTFKLGASCIDIYVVAYVANNFGPGRQIFFDFIREKNITTRHNSIQAIWQVGRGDGFYLDILNKDGSIKDCDFLKKWSR